MTNEQGLNEMLAKQVGFTLETRDCVGLVMYERPQRVWYYKGIEYGWSVPQFTQSLDACFARLKPWIRVELGVAKVSFSYMGESIWCLLWGGFQAGDELGHAYIERGNEALALCRAIENLHNSLSSLQSNRESAQQAREKHNG